MMEQIEQEVVKEEVMPEVKEEGSQPAVKAPSVEDLKAKYLNLCTQLGEKQLHMALLSDESMAVIGDLKLVAKDLFPLMQPSKDPANV